MDTHPRSSAVAILGLSVLVLLARELRMHSRPARAAVRVPIGQIAGHRTAAPAVNTADRPGMLPRPRVLTSDGCSGSSYLWWFSSQLFALHTGFATVGPSGMMTPAEWEAFARERPDVKLVPDSANSEYLSGENFPIHFMVNHTLPRTEWRFDAGFQMVKRTWDQVVVNHVFEGTDTLHTPTGRGKPLEERTVLRSPEAGPAACAPHSPAGNCTANAMVVKMLLYQMFQPGVGPALKALRPLLVHTYRRNWLGRLACRIKDITTHEMYGQPVMNGFKFVIFHPDSTRTVPVPGVDFDPLASVLPAAFASFLSHARRCRYHRPMSGNLPRVSTCFVRFARFRRG